MKFKSLKLATATLLLFTFIAASNAMPIICAPRPVNFDLVDGDGYVSTAENATSAFSTYPINSFIARDSVPLGDGERVDAVMRAGVFMNLGFVIDGTPFTRLNPQAGEKYNFFRGSPSEPLKIDSDGSAVVAVINDAPNPVHLRMVYSRNRVQFYTVDDEGNALLRYTSQFVSSPLLIQIRLSGMGWINSMQRCRIITKRPEALPQ